MKKIASLTALLLMAITAFTFTSCNDDEEIADTLWGVWSGEMGIYYDFDGRSYQTSNTVIAFDRDPGYYSSGSGYWIDYFTNAPYDYYATHIQWSVYNGIINIYSEEDGESWRIYDYNLSYNTFSGCLDNGYDQPMWFSLYKTSAPNWDSYYWGDYYGYDSYGNYVKRPDTRSADSAKAVPKRRIGAVEK